jgi:alpha-glucosidase
MGKVGWPTQKGRDGERTPMQWTAETNAGFSAVAPWLPVDEHYKTYNVQSEKKDPGSILNYYHQLLSLRHTNAALLDGKYTVLNESDPNVLSYARSYKGKSVLVVLNMSDTTRKVSLNLASSDTRTKKARTLLASFPAASQVEIGEISVAPFGAWIGETE